MSNELIPVNQNISCIFDTGEFKSLTDDDATGMTISGWASTKDVDLEGHVVLPTAFNKWFPEYQTKGRYWFNHDPNAVIGHVKKARLTDDGFYIDEAVLSPTAFNKSYLFPLIKDGGINEHSIQFWSLENEYDKVAKVLYHKEVRLIETSIVSVACNPGAVIENFKAYLPSVELEHCSFETLLELEKQGLLKYPSEIRKQFAILENPLVEAKSNDEAPDESNPSEEMTTPNLSPDFRGFVPVEKSIDKQDHDARKDSESAPFPKKHHKSYNEIVEPLFLAKSVDKDSYLFRVGEMTVDGPRYNWDDVAVSLGMLFGVKGGYLLEDSVKLQLIQKVADIYGVFEKALPTYDGVSLSDLDDETVLEVKWADLDFSEGEAQIVEATVFSSNMKSVSDLLNKYKKDGEFPEFIATTFEKYLGMEVGFYSNMSEWTSDEERTLVFDIMTMISEFFDAKQANDYSLSLETFAEHLTERLELEEKSAETETEETVEDEPESIDITKELIEKFKKV